MQRMLVGAGMLGAVARGMPKQRRFYVTAVLVVHAETPQAAADVLTDLHPPTADVPLDYDGDAIVEMAEDVGENADLKPIPYSEFTARVDDAAILGNILRARRAKEG